jgi:hypothetical protein
MPFTASGIDFKPHLSSLRSSTLNSFLHRPRTAAVGLLSYD